MYKLNYFQNHLSDSKCKSFDFFRILYSQNQLDQPIIFCDKYITDPIGNIPIFHSYFVNQHFNNSIILTDYDQIEYIKYFNNSNFLIVYNPDVHNIDQYINSYKFISINDDITTFMKDNYNG